MTMPLANQSKQRREHDAEQRWVTTVGAISSALHLNDAETRSFAVRQDDLSCSRNAPGVRRFVGF